MAKKKFKRKKAKNKQKRAINTSKKKKQETIQENLRRVARPIIKPKFAMRRGKMKLF